MSIWSRGVAAAEDLATELLGVSVHKAIDPLDPDGFVVIGDRVAAALRKAVRGGEADVVRGALDALNIDWNKASPNAVDRAIEAAKVSIKAHYEKFVLPKVNDTLELQGPILMKGVKRAVIAREQIEIAPVLTLRDEGAETAIRRQHVNFIRNGAGKRLERMSEEARAIVARGFSEGLGRNVIGRDLKDHFTDRIVRPDSYWNVVASAYIGRARSTSQVYAYEDAGIQTFEVVAVLDEVTTDQCRFMDGKVFTIRSARQILDTVEDIEDPEDVVLANPWIRKGRDPAGGMRLFVPTKGGGTETLAKIDRSGLGKLDDKGSFSGGKSAAGMSKLGVSMPPYHGLCRTVIVAGAEMSEEKPVRAPRAKPAPKPKPKPPPGAMGAGVLPDVPRPSAALKKKASTLHTESPRFYYDSKNTPTSPEALLEFRAGKCMALMSSPETKREYADWMSSWVGRSTKELATKARKGVLVEKTAAQDGYLATQAWIEAHMPELRKPRVINGVDAPPLIDEDGFVTLFRGVHGQPARECRKAHSKKETPKLEIRDAASWSEDRDIARSFTFGGDDGVVLMQKIHYTRAFSCFRANGSGWIGNNEQEWTMLHDDDFIEVNVVELMTR